MIQIRLLSICLLTCCVCSVGWSQTQYPSTRYQGFDQGGDWATSTPAALDAVQGNDHSAMSPDSWATPSTKYVPPNKSQLSGATPQIPDLNDSTSVKPFKSIGMQNGNQENPDFSEPTFSATPKQAIPTPNSMRYPLGGQANGNQSQPSYGQYPPPSAGSNFGGVDSWYDPITGGQHPQVDGEIVPNTGAASDSSQLSGIDFLTPNYRPDLGHRSDGPTFRQRIAEGMDNGQQFGFENKKKEYPPMKEILATGRYFGSANLLYLKGAFQNNTAIAIEGSSFVESIPFDFDYEAAHQFRLGFESKYGPGIELDYWQYDESSNVASFTSDGSFTGTTSTWLIGPSQWSRLTADDAAERLDTSHSIDIESFGASFFKELKFKISRVNGMFGFQYVSIAQSLDATLNSGGSVTDRLNSRSDMRAFGPKFDFQYYRPVGHTKLELFTTAGGSVLFGKRDQYVSNTVTGDISLQGSDELLSMIEFETGFQYKKMIAENRAYYGRFGLTYQAWLGGGTAVNVQDDFGLHGFSFAVGYNR